MSGLHLVLLPKDDDPSKAVLAACNEKELIRLAAQKCSTSTGNGLYFCYGRARLVTICVVLNLYNYISVRAYVVMDDYF